MIKILKVSLGLGLLAVGLWAIIVLRQDFMALLKGLLGPVLLLTGIIILAISRD